MVPLLYFLSQYPLSITELILKNSIQDKIDSDIYKSQNRTLYTSTLKNAPQLTAKDFNMKQIYYQYNKFTNSITLDIDGNRKNYDLNDKKDLDQIAAFLIYKQ
ncbi:hypothetical protein [Carp edema virus]|nr:hypothetical protein [Carp edema virus]